jgi:hypothetical protein
MAITLEPGVSRGPSKDKDVAVQIIDAKWDSNYVRGKSQFASIAGIITFRGDDGEEFTQNYKAGSPEIFAVTPDGLALTSAKPEERADDKLRLSPKAEISHLFNSLIKNGVSVAKLGTSIKNLVGIKGTVRAFVTDTYTKADGTTGENLTVMFTKVDPASIGSAVAPSPTPAATAVASAPAAATAGNGSSGTAEYAATVLRAIIPEGSSFIVGDGLKDLKKAALQNFVKAKVPPASRVDTMKLITSADFISGVEGFLYDPAAGEISRM